MTAHFSQWATRIDEAGDPAALRKLLGEIGVWRARHLLDIPAQRHAAWALSEIHHRLGQAEPAIAEADQLVSLCRAAPESTREELVAAEHHRRAVGGRPQKVPRAERPARAERPDRPERGDRAERKARGDKPARDVAGDRASGGLEQAVAHAVAGRFDAAREALGAPRGPRGLLVATWIDLAAAASQGLDNALVQGALHRLAEHFGAVRAPGAGAVEQLLGRRLPSGREAALDAMEAFAAANPERDDALAAAALRDHVAASGLRATAPWLATLVGRALAAEGAETTSALAELRDAGAFAVTCYDEPAAAFLVDLARVSGLRLSALRRGVLSRGEPGERKVWTLRLPVDGGEVLVAAAPTGDEPYDDDLAARLARRLAQLCPRVFVVAPGPENAGLRAAGLAVGLTVTDKADVHGAAAVLAEVPARAVRSERTERPERAERPERGAAATEAAAERAPRGPSPLAQIAALFDAEAPSAAEAYADALAALRRVFKAFGAVRDSLAARAAEDADARLAPLLRAVHDAAPPAIRLTEGASLAIQTAARAPAGQVDALLRQGDALAERFGGAGVDALVDVSRGLLASGVSIARVLSGLTRRERTGNPALAALEGDLGGLWRLLVEHDGRRGEVWVLAGLTPEATAAAIQLLQEDRPRVVFGDEAALAAVGGLAGDAVAADADAALARMATWPVTAPGADGDDEA